MPIKARRRQRRDTFELLSLWVTGYEVQVELGVNGRLRMKPLWGDLDTPVMQARSWLEVRGKCVYPEERKGEKFVFTMVGEQSPPDFAETVADIQQRDAHGMPQYRTYRGSTVPVFKCPKGVTQLLRQRRADPWSAWMHVPAGYLSDCLMVLSTRAVHYIYLHEHIVENERWLNTFALQSNDPAE